MGDPLFGLAVAFWISSGLAVLFGAYLLCNKWLWAQRRADGDGDRGWLRRPEPGGYGTLTWPPPSGSSTSDFMEQPGAGTDIDHGTDNGTDNGNGKTFVQLYGAELVAFTVLLLVALGTGIAWLVVRAAQQPRQCDVYFTAVGDGWSPARWTFNASASLALACARGDYHDLLWRFGDGTSAGGAGAWLPVAMHWYNDTAIQPDGATVNLTISLQIGCTGATGTGRQTISVRDGYPMVVFDCWITSPIRFAPVNATCSATASYGQHGHTVVRYEFDMGDGVGWRDLGPRPILDRVWLVRPGDDKVLQLQF